VIHRIGELLAEDRQLQAAVEWYTSGAKITEAIHGLDSEEMADIRRAMASLDKRPMEQDAGRMEDEGIAPLTSGSASGAEGVDGSARAAPLGSDECWSDDDGEMAAIVAPLPSKADRAPEQQPNQPREEIKLKQPRDESLDSVPIVSPTSKRKHSRPPNPSEQRHNDDAGVLFGTPSISPSDEPVVDRLVIHHEADLRPVRLRQTKTGNGILHPVSRTGGGRSGSAKTARTGTDPGESIQGISRSPSHPDQRELVAESKPASHLLLAHAPERLRPIRPSAAPDSTRSARLRAKRQSWSHGMPPAAEAEHLRNDDELQKRGSTGEEDDSVATELVIAELEEREEVQEVPRVSLSRAGRRASVDTVPASRGAANGRRPSFKPSLRDTLAKKPSSGSARASDTSIPTAVRGHGPRTTPAQPRGTSSGRPAGRLRASVDGAPRRGLKPSLSTKEKFFYRNSSIESEAVKGRIRAQRLPSLKQSMG